MEGLQGFFATAAAYLNKGGKGAPREVARAFNGGKSELEKYLISLLEWGTEPNNAAAAVRATVNAAALGLQEPGQWIGERALKFAVGDKRPRKDLLVQLMQAASKLGAFELAVRAGDAAVRLDPSDAKLGSEVRNMSAQATMTRGGYEKTGEQGGFRSNVRDAAKQTRLEAEDRIAKTEETLESLLDAAKVDYEARPDDKPSIMKYVKYLIERGRTEDEVKAIELLLGSFERFNEYRFKESAGELRIRQAKRRVAEAEKAGDADALGAARRGLLETETAEFAERVAAYPTDLTRKFEYGKRLQESGKHEEAIGQFQQSKTDTRLRAKSLYHLGVSFGAIDFNDEAIDTFRAALELGGEQDEKTKMALRYGLMLALMGRAAEQRSLSDAEEAGKLASSIAIQEIGYRDIRAKREELKALTAKLRGG
jgi:tetratricopeptide (TPR) repeat protein